MRPSLLLPALILLAGCSASPSPASSADALPLAQLAGDWAGTLTYTEYSDDATRVTLTVSAEVEPIRPETTGEGARLSITFVEPDGSPGGSTVAEIAAIPGVRGVLFYGSDRWAIVERGDVTADGFSVTIEAESVDNNRAATIRHTLQLRDGVFTDRKDVRYAGTDAFFERNTFRFERR